MSSEKFSVFGALYRGIARLTRWALRLGGVVVVAAVVLYVWKVLDPPGPIEPHPDTTVIAGPLAEDGLPDYAKAVVERLKEGVTPESNGAIPFWKAIGPDPIEASDRERFFQELGTPVPKTHGSSLDPYDLEVEPKDIARVFGIAWDEEERQEAWEDRWEDTDDDHSDEKPRLPDAGKAIAPCLERAWTRDQAPFLAEWLDERRERIDLLLEAVQKPNFYSPPPNLLRPKPPLLLDADFPHVGAMRDAARALMLHAMLRLGEGDPADSWRHLEAALVLSQHLREMTFEIDFLVGVAVNGMVFNAFAEWIQNVDDESLLDQAARRLDRCSADQHMARIFGYGLSLREIEPLIASLVNRDNAEPELSGDSGLRPPFIDGNVLLARIRHWQIRIERGLEAQESGDTFVRPGYVYDRVSKAADSTYELLPRIASFISRHAVSEMVADKYTTISLPAIAATMHAEQRTLTSLRVARCGVALRRYKLAEGAYPENLTTLYASYPETPRVDAYNDEPFRYERRGDGFLLYGESPSDGDQGGTCMTGRVVDGEWTEPPQEDLDFADLVLRVPRPALAIPFTIPAPKDTIHF